MGTSAWTWSLGQQLEAPCCLYVTRAVKSQVLAFLNHSGCQRGGLAWCRGASRSPWTHCFPTLVASVLRTEACVVLHRAIQTSRTYTGRHVVETCSLWGAESESQETGHPESPMLECHKVQVLRPALCPGLGGQTPGRVGGAGPPGHQAKVPWPLRQEPQTACTQAVAQAVRGQAPAEDSGHERGPGGVTAQLCRAGHSHDVVTF